MRLHLDKNQVPILTEEQAVLALLSAKKITQAIIDPGLAEEYRLAVSKTTGDEKFQFYNETTDSFHEVTANTWLIPNEYKTLDVFSLLRSKCQTPEEHQRLELEWQLFEKHHFIDILRAVVYIIDTFKQNNIVWGVGRGSSVSSFVLYLLDVHLVNPIQYDLDVNEFFKEQI